jgi:Flp pilus assembly protein TadG
MNKPVSSTRAASIGLRLAQDRRCVTAVETAIALPVFLILVMGTIAAFGLLEANRAIDFGLERALRYAAVHGGSGIAGVQAVFASSAGAILSDVGVNATVQVTPTNFTNGNTVSITVTYVWNSPVGTTSPWIGSWFPQQTLSMTSQMLCVAP